MIISFERLLGPSPAGGDRIMVHRGITTKIPTDRKLDVVAKVSDKRKAN